MKYVEASIVLCRGLGLIKDYQRYCCWPIVSNQHAVKYANFKHFYSKIIYGQLFTPVGLNRV